MLKTWLRYLLYFLCPLAVVFLGWLIYAGMDGLLSIADRGAALLLIITCLLLAGAVSLYVTIKQCQSVQYSFSISSERQKKLIIDRIQLLLKEELPAKSRVEPMGKVIFDGSYSIYLGMREPVIVEEQRDAVVVRAPKKLLELIINEINAIDPIQAIFS